MIRFVSLAALAAALAVTPAVAQEQTPQAAAEAFVARAEADYARAMIESGQAEWVYQTYINQDTEALTARAEAAFTGVLVSNALEAAKHATTPGLSYDTRRKLDRMRTLIVLPAPTAPGAAEEVAGLKARMQGIYGRGKGTLLTSYVPAARLSNDAGDLWAGEGDAQGATDQRLGHRGRDGHQPQPG